MTAAVPVRREHIVLYALLTSLTAISIDALLPGLRQMGRDLGTPPPLSTHHVISLFIFGMAFGELLVGPLSDALGRRRTLGLGLCLYAAGTAIALLAGSLEAVILGRILQGIGVSGPKIATRAMIRDRFEGAAMARILSFIFTLLVLVPMLAPALGQGLVALAGWRGVFGFYLLMAAVLGLWVALRLPETLSPSRRIPFRPRLLAGNAGRILADRQVSLLIAATGLVFGAQLLYLSIAADLFFDLYGIAETFPFYFAALAAAVGLASFLNARLVRRVGMEAMARRAFRGLTAAGLLLLLACAIWAGRPPLPVFLGLGFGAFFAIGLLFGNLNALAMRSLGQLAGLGASLIAALSSLIATLFTVALGAFYDGTALPLAVGFSLAGAGALALGALAMRAEPAMVEALRQTAAQGRGIRSDVREAGRSGRPGRR
ncbi:multidrug effflux MFS transporter [Tropicimonas sp. IMCC34043]|uniref:multidrug effflux MFS transporter n=1 Tax=Tropicimonas sp. IMCC34043 TaxID=2248760 RepID=UPI000E22D11F|nr:multidrug effflux MFS transporter [Tropicimonas sp. IMCC34043]